MVLTIKLAYSDGVCMSVTHRIMLRYNNHVLKYVLGGLKGMFIIIVSNLEVRRLIGDLGLICLSIEFVIINYKRVIA